MKYGKEQTQKLRGELEKNKLDALLLINLGSNCIDKNFYYFTGIEWVEHSYALIGKDFEKLFLSGFELERCKKETWMPEVSRIAPKKGWQKEAFRDIEGKKVGINGDFLPSNEYNWLKKNGLKLFDASKLIRELRIVKTKEEVEFIRKAAGITAKFYQKIDFGKSEGHIAGKIRNIAGQNESKLGSDSIVAYDENSALPHAKVTSKKGSRVLLIDAGAAYKGYTADVTRTFGLKKNDAEFEKVYNLVLNVQERAIKGIRPGIKANSIDKFVRSELKKNGYELLHGTGHGIGLDEHEGPWISEREDAVLKEGMVFTVEPAIYIKNKFGVRIEDDVLVTRNGCEVLTRKIKK